MSRSQHEPEDRQKSKAAYEQAGVHPHRAEQLITWLQEKQGQSPAAASPYGQTLAGIGGFASLFRLNLQSFASPVLVASSDGIGTKVLLALTANHLEGLGIDLVAMCVNDLYTVGAHPLFFLDYYATGALDPQQFKGILSSIQRGLAQCGAELLGGETAEMPGLYAPKHFDLAGFMVGVVDEAKTLGAHRVRAGDTLVGLAATGFHSNGYSLIRKWLAASPAEQNDAPLLAKLLAPTKIYHELTGIGSQLGESLHALAHITGGGLRGNLPRVIPPGLACHITWPQEATPDWMASFMANHGLSLDAGLDVFNLGIGMIACVDSEDTAKTLLAMAAKAGTQGYLLGQVTPAAAASGPQDLVRVSFGPNS